VYFLVFGMGVYYMMKLMRRGPSLQAEHVDDPEYPGLSNRALSQSFR